MIKTMMTIFQAIEAGNFEEVKKLCTLEPDNLKARDDNAATLVYRAASYGHLEITKWLVGKGVDPGITNMFGYAPLQAAVMYRHFETVKWFIEQDAARLHAVDQHSRTLANLAAKCGHLSILQYLAEKDATQLKAADQYGKTSVHLAVEGQDLPTIHGLSSIMPDANGIIMKIKPYPIA
jgi:ankyrin repeat protein